MSKLKTIALVSVIGAGLALSAPARAAMPQEAGNPATAPAPAPAGRAASDAARPPAPAATPEARQALRDYASCVLRVRPKTARAVLALDFRTDEYQKALRSVTDGNSGCILGRLRGAGVLFAGAIAEAAFAADYGAKPVTEVIPADWTAKPIQARTDGEATALCLVQKRSADAVALAGANPGGPKENAAIDALAKTLPECVKTGTTMRMNVPFLRAITSLALYRAANHFAAVPGVAR